MKPNKARGRVMGQDVRGKRFEPEGLGMFHGMKEKVRRREGRQGTGPEGVVKSRKEAGFGLRDLMEKGSNMMRRPIFFAPVI